MAVKGERATDVTVRKAGTQDAEDLYEVFACPGVARDTLGLPYTSPDRITNMLENVKDGEHHLVAVVGGKVVGELGLSRRRDRRSHVSDLGMGVHDDYQGRGVGTALMEAAMDLADSWLNLKRVELHVYTDNARAIHLYEKFEFAIEGTHRAFAFRDGEYVDAHSMARVRDQASA